MTEHTPYQNLSNLELDELTLKLMGLPKHIPGGDWPSCPFYGIFEKNHSPYDPKGIAFIRWNNADYSQSFQIPKQGRLDKQITENWVPSVNMHQAMELWTEFPPPDGFMRLEIGKDGFVIRIVTQDKEYQIIDDYQCKLTRAITELWVFAMTQVRFREAVTSL